MKTAFYLIFTVLLFTVFWQPAYSQEIQNTSKRKKMEKEIYTFVDFNNNKFIVTENLLQYNPVFQENSSSGFYTGGKYQEIELQKSDFQMIKKLFENALDSKEEHTVQRQMLTCILQKELGGAKQLVILKPKSQISEEILTIVKKYISD